MMKVLLILALAVCNLAWSQVTPVLRPGDVLLQPLKCWACSLIEAEEDTIYSHIGVVLAVEPEVLVGEAWFSVRKTTLKEFNARTEPGQKIMVLRFRNDDLSAEFTHNSQGFMRTFETDFEGMKYDHDFRWNNFDETGREKLYCSELLSKLFQAFVGIDTPIKRMHFEMNRDAWMTYFRGNVPDREWGNSPGDYHRSELFYEVGEL